MNGATLILPAWYLALALLLLTATGLASALGIRRLMRGVRRRRQGEPDWSLPQLDGDSLGNSPFHRWEVRGKLVGLLGLAFFMVTLSSLTASLAAFSIALLIVLASRVPLERPLARLLAMSGFLGMFLLVMPFSAPPHPGDTLIRFAGLDSWAWNLRGLHKAATICLKAGAVALLMEPLLATAPLPVTLQGLHRLGLPAALGQMLLLAHRYSHVFRHEAWRMATGMRLRGFQPGSNRQALAAYGNYLGMLFVRSFERTERVYDAMQARGYRGRFPEPEPQQVQLRDLVLTGLFLLIGIALLVADRWCF
ncbi:MAG: hypothetical protein Kow00100_24480 [Geothermobacteraceae bacterium]